MISLTRLPEPEILKRNEEKWLHKFLERRSQKNGARPDSKQYGHRAVRDVLRAMSSHKCFYCETKMSDAEGQVDHYREVSAFPEKAFDWENLYLSCRCHLRKLSEATIPVRECLDPCDVSEDPADHLTFEDEVISPRKGSSKGSQTIKKYRLDREGLNYRRGRHLLKFERFLRTLRELQLRDGGRSLNAREMEALKLFTQADHPFSLMFRVYRDKLDLPPRS